MKFRTEVNIQNSEKKIEMQDSIFSIGSCFSSEISTLLAEGQLQTLNNPFGTIFNPYSISNAVERIIQKKIYTEKELICHNSDYISLDHHTSFDSQDLDKTLRKINTKLTKGYEFLKSSKWVIITLGTSFIYEYLPQNKWVANCHKIPNQQFRKQLLSDTAILNSLENIINNLQSFCTEDIQILFTVSPVRHTKDGMIENQRSKSKLINQLHEIISNKENCQYLPIYEIMMDDLRDYRFYKEDMIHPNSQAINYIFEKFKKAYCSENTIGFIEENFKISKSLSHRFSEDNQHLKQEIFNRINQKISNQQKKVAHKIFRDFSTTN